MKFHARTVVAPMAAAVLISVFVAQGLAVEIIGHRGASYDAPENTLAAVHLAWKQQADAVEIDIYLSRDGRIVAIHDSTTKRYGGPDRKVSEQTYAELRALDVGSWKDARFAGEQIPPLEAVLETIPQGKRLFIEIKAGAEIIPELKRVIRASGKQPAQMAIIGFSYATMSAVKKTLPRHEVYWVVGVKRDRESGRWRPALEGMIAKAKAARLDGLDLGNSPAVIDADYVRRVKGAGLGMYVWTVNDAREAARLTEAGVDGITTDRPGWLRERLETREMQQSAIDMEESPDFCQHVDSTEVPAELATAAESATEGAVP